MTTPKFDQAREWSDRMRNASDNGHPIDADCYSAAEVIHSLPDQWIDADKLRKVLEEARFLIRDGGPEIILNDLAALLPTPRPRTLADLIEAGNDPQKYVGMQCMIHDFPSTRVITKVRGSHVSVLREDLEIQHADTSKVTPLPDLPKLEWPAQEPRNSEEIVKVIRHEKELCLDSQDFSRAGLWRDMERAAGQGDWKDLLNSIRELKLPKDSGTPRNPRTEDVPPGEPWSVRYYGKEWAGVRADDDRAPWSIISMDGLDYRDVDDSEVTLMFRLVPETP